MAVHDLVVKDDDLVVGTHGRSIWILDDLTPLPRVQPPRRRGRRASVPAAGRRRAGGTDRATGARAAPFSNPPHGASIYYSLKDEEKGELKIEILDCAAASSAR